MSAPEQVGAGRPGRRAGGWRSAGEGRWAGVAPWVRAREGARTRAQEVEAARPGPARAVPRRGKTRRVWGRRAVPGRRPREEPGAVSRLPPRLPREGRFPPGRRPGPAGSRALVCGNPLPGPAPPRLPPLAGAPRGAGRGAGRAQSCGRSGHVGPARRLLPAGAEQDTVGGAAAAAGAAPGGLGRLRLSLVGAGWGGRGGLRARPSPPCGVPTRGGAHPASAPGPYADPRNE